MRANDEGEPALEMVPAPATPITFAGLFNCGVLVTLKASARNCPLTLASRRISMSLKSETFNCAVGGPNRVLRPALPKVNAAGVEKQAGLNHLEGERCEAGRFGSQRPGLDVATGSS